MSISNLDGLLGPIEIRGEPSKIRHVRPRSCSQILDDLALVIRGVEMGGKVDGQTDQLLGLDAAGTAAFPALIQHPLEQSPGLVPRRVGQQEHASLLIAREQVGQEARSFGPFSMKLAGTFEVLLLAPLDGRSVICGITRTARTRAGQPQDSCAESSREILEKVGET